MSKNVPITFRWRREIINYEWDRKIRRAVMAVAFILEYHADADGMNVYPSVGTIADLACISHENVRKILKLMREHGFLRPYGKTRYGTIKYRLVYQNRDIEVGAGRTTSKSKSASTTKRTQGTLGSPTSKNPKKAKSLSRSAKSPKATIATRSSTSKPIISVPIIEDDLVVLERCKDHSASANSNLGKVTARGKSVVSKSQAQIDAENIRIQSQVDQILETWVDAGISFNGDFYPTWEHQDKGICEVFDLVYQDFGLFSKVCTTVQHFDRKDWNWVAQEMRLHRWLTDERRNLIESHLELTAWRAFSAFSDAIRRHRLSKHFATKVSAQDLEVEKIFSLTVREIRSRFYWISETIVKEIRDEQNENARQNANEWSRSATNTGSDAMIVEKIVETVSEKVDERDVERW